jgi:aromatic-L-amino-acid decarboxylase
MKLEHFRQYAHEVVDWSFSFFQNLRKLPVKTKSKYGDLRVELPLSPPQRGESFEDIWKDFCEKIVPRVNHWQHPHFFAYFPMNNSYPSILADLAASVLNTQAMSWELSPAATELEETVLSWIQQEMRLPIHVRGVIHDTASTSTLCALMAARDRATNHQLWEEGFQVSTPALILYCSEEAHSSIEKAHLMLGLGRKQIRKIKLANDGGLCVSTLKQTIDADIKQGFKPYAIVGCYGTTGSGHIDPIKELGEVAKEYGVWFHVDAAYGGPTLLLREFQERFLVRHWQFDSFVFNPHKWMLTGFDCSVMYVANPQEYQASFQVNPSYLKNLNEVDDETPTEFRHWGPALGRRFRALKLWFVLRSYGMEGIHKHLRGHLNMAKHFAQEIKKLPEIEITNELHFSLVCFRWTGEKENQFNQAWLKQINDDGLYLSHNVDGEGHFVLRFAVGSTFCTMEDINHAARIIHEAFLKLRNNQGPS